ncbi:hypothetical protein M9H77_06843 [Catharanthus roseus]|uniref:Uncharacterized protein n=1 Tax=Catharanthus roseus TaxID=4058 RepID=A0ACC0BT89_CATRO|nr:hypothetical protein M9H77_06843 [Catharanthus roseus]
MGRSGDYNVSNTFIVCDSSPFDVEEVSRMNLFKGRGDDMNWMSPSFKEMKLGLMTRSQMKKVQLQEDNDILICIMEALKNKDGEFEGHRKHSKAMKEPTWRKFWLSMEENHPTANGRFTPTADHTYLFVGELETKHLPPTIGFNHQYRKEPKPLNAWVYGALFFIGSSLEVEASNPQ